LKHTETEHALSPLFPVVIVPHLTGNYTYWYFKEKFGFCPLFFEIGSYSVAQAGFELAILLSQPPCASAGFYRCVPPHPTIFLLLKRGPVALNFDETSLQNSVKGKTSWPNSLTVGYMK
jgi:hypothetical protein